MNKMLMFTGGGESFVVTGVCPTGQTCVYSNDWYSQCVPGTGTGTTAAVVQTSSASKKSACKSKTAVQTSSTATLVTSSTEAIAEATSAISVAVAKIASTSSEAIAVSTTKTATAATSAASSSSGLQWLGVTESGAEFGTTALPGVLGTDYTWPLTSSIQTLLDAGMNIFRIPFLMERLAQGTMTATLDATYLAALETIVTFVTAAGASVVLDPHNYGRYDGVIFTSTSDFQTFWTNVATVFATNDLVIFDCNNEFHDEPTDTTVAELSQACIDGVRAAGATTQYIFIEGTVRFPLSSAHDQY